MELDIKELSPKQPQENGYVNKFIHEEPEIQNFTSKWTTFNFAESFKHPNMKEYIHF